MKNLPNKASELIRLAIGDLEKAEASERYVIDMGNWHTPENLIKGSLYSDKCAICLAGAVMAFSLDIDPGIHCEPVDLDAVNGWKLRALIGGSFDAYEQSPEEFKKKMREMADALAAYDF